MLGKGMRLAAYFGIVLAIWFAIIAVPDGWLDLEAASEKLILLSLTVLLAAVVFRSSLTGPRLITDYWVPGYLVYTPLIYVPVQAIRPPPSRFSHS